MRRPSPLTSRITRPGTGATVGEVERDWGPWDGTWRSELGAVAKSDVTLEFESGPLDETS